MLPPVTSFSPSIAGYIPGYWATFFLIDKWGRKPIQLMSFIVFAVLFIVMGFAYDALTATKKGADTFFFLFCLATFFQNYRSTAHGICAASGKLGAVISQVGFAKLAAIKPNNGFMGHTLEILAFFMLTGILSTLPVTETNQKTLW